MSETVITKSEAMKLADHINFDKMEGLLPVVTQDFHTKDVLMLAFMNRESFIKTLSTGKAWYYSRKRRRLWMKGEQSGHFQLVRKVLLDCDDDSVLLIVDQQGGACDLGYSSCFLRKLEDKQWLDQGTKVFDPRAVYAYSEDLSLVTPSGSLSKMTKLLLKKSDLLADDDISDRTILRQDGVQGIIDISMSDPFTIPRLVESGKHDLGITGRDCVVEAGANVTELCDLRYNKVGLGLVVWVLAARKRLGIVVTSQLDRHRIYTPLVNTARRWLASRGISAELSRNFDDMATVDAIIEICESGDTVRKQGYEPIDALGTSSAVLIANNNSVGYSWKRVRMESLCRILSSAAQKLPRNTKALVNIAGTAGYKQIS